MGTGEYSVSLAGFYRTTGLAETFLVSPVGTTPGRCQVQIWADSDLVGTPTNVQVSCQNISGTPTDMAFTLVGLQEAREQAPGRDVREWKKRAREVTGSARDLGQGHGSERAMGIILIP